MANAGMNGSTSTNGTYTSGALESRDLFGGAIKAELPKGLIDASDLRQIPDNQEVLLSPDSNISLVVEVLQSVREGQAATDLEEAIKFHFSSLAHDNSAQHSSITQIYSTSPSSLSSTTSSPPTPRPLLLAGTQSIQKFGRAHEPSDTVRIYLALWRLEGKGVDLVLSVNEPLGDAAGVGARQEGAQGQEQGKVQKVFEKAASSLKVMDWGLFA